MKKFNLKHGSVLLWKDYNVFKRFWAWLTGKKLPYNRWMLWNSVMDNACFLNMTSPKAYELVKPYNNKELKKLENFATKTSISEVIVEDDLKLIINCIRPNTIDVNGGTIDGDWLAGNKYYRLYNEKAK